MSEFISKQGLEKWIDDNWELSSEDGVRAVVDHGKLIAAINSPRLSPAPEGDLREAFEALYKGYINVLQMGRDKIIDLGGECDPVDVMERNDPCLRDARAALANTGDGWIPVSEWKIKSGEHVFVSYLNSHKKRRMVKAFYATKYSIESNIDEDFLEYYEENDTYYVPEGWYECIDNWDEFTSIKINEGTVDYVMPLPPQPDSRGAG
jgi:hypothetical protein